MHWTQVNTYIKRRKLNQTWYFNSTVISAEPTDKERMQGFFMLRTHQRKRPVTSFCLQIIIRLSETIATTKSYTAYMFASF